MSNIGKNGVVKTDTFYESESVILNSGSSFSYTPTANATNSCNEGPIVDYSNYLDADLVVRVKCDVTWTTFTTSTSGTLSMWWQGSNYSISDAAFKWAGTNYVVNALTNKKSLTSLITTTSGTYHYDTTATIPASWFSTYSKSHVGIRTDYSDGTGKITVSNFTVEPEKYNGDIAKVFNTHINANEIIEY